LAEPARLAARVRDGARHIGAIRPVKLWAWLPRLKLTPISVVDFNFGAGGVESRAWRRGSTGSSPDRSCSGSAQGRDRWTAISADCLWRSLGIVVELDGRAAHRRNLTFESDRLRDRRLGAIGMRPVRITWRQLEADPDALEADLSAIGVRDRLGA
jgi:hypothetical protein